MSDFPELSGADFSGISQRGTLVVGFSGGADSTVLLHCLLEAAGSRDRIVLAHVNHGLRGAEADRDEAFCREQAGKLGVRFACLHTDVKALAQQEGVSVEVCGREVRYRFFESLLEEGEGTILTAHHGDDNAETMLMNLVRGTSLLGLCGIPRQRGRILRPLLRVSREEIEQYCAARGLAYVTDSSNLTDEYGRNRIRNRVMPLLREENPRLSEAMGRTAESLRLLQEYLDGEAEKLLSGAVRDGKLETGPLRQAHPALRLEALKLYLEDRGCRGLEKRHLESAQSVALRGGRCCCGRFYGECPICLPAGQAAGSRSGFCGKQCCQTKILILEKKPCPDLENGRKINNLLFKNSFDYATMTGVFLARTRREGDRFTPVGRRVTKGLKQLFQEQRVPASQRENMVLLECGGQIVFCEGVGVAEPFRITPRTETLVAVTVSNPLQEGKA
ncbi:MAG: tRNA lysidine(34) synthetase TilS [Neglectibacter timonensis]